MVLLHTNCISVTLYVPVWASTTYPNYSWFRCSKTTHKIQWKIEYNANFFFFFGCLYVFLSRFTKSRYHLQYKACRGLVPDYISGLLSPWEPECSLRSSVSNSQVKAEKQWSPGLQGPSAQECLSIRLTSSFSSFNSLLKTHDFKTPFSQIVWFCAFAAVVLFNFTC